MPSVLLTESLAVELGAQEPWPQDVKLFQPYEVEQILLPDNANCLAVQAFLKMCSLDFEVEPRSNAEYMSPSGRVPFIKCGAFVVAELDPIISFVNSKGISLSDKLDNAQKADMRAYMSLVNTVLANAELYVTWCDKATLQEVTKPRFGSVLPWPLNHIIAWQKRGQVVKKLGVLGWAHKSLDEVYQEVENCCSALSERLENRPYFFGDRPTELDAVVFGHLFAILTTPLPLPNNQIASTVRFHKKLLELVKRIDHQFFGRDTRVSQDSLPGMEAEITPGVEEQAQDTAEGGEEQAQDTAEGAEEQAQDTAEGAEEQAQDTAEGAEEQAQETAEGGEEQAQDTAEGAEEQAQETVEGGEEQAQDTAEGAEEQAQETVEGGEEQAQDTAEGAEEQAQ